MSTTTRVMIFFEHEETVTVRKFAYVDVRPPKGEYSAPKHLAEQYFRAALKCGVPIPWQTAMVGPGPTPPEAIPVPADVWKFEFEIVPDASAPVTAGQGDPDFAEVDEPPPTVAPAASPRDDEIPV